VCSVTRGLMIRASPRYSHDYPARGRGPAGFPPLRPPRPRVGVEGGFAPGRGRGRFDSYLSGGGRSACRGQTSIAPQTSSPSPAPATPQFGPGEVDTAKQHRCQVFDVSVRGAEGQGGLRVEGNLNVPMVLRMVNSAAVVQNALVPAVPADVASSARKYISAALGTTTAAMGNTPTPEVNRLNDVRNDAIDALIDARGRPR
jgi:hypothetical protein